MTIQMYYRQKILGSFESGPKALYLGAEHNQIMAKNLQELRKGRDEQRLRNLEEREKEEHATRGKVIHADVKHAFFSMIIKLGDEV